ncbi:F-box domain, cyclin-like protein [Beauveria brongniartii RCEF 3172]|uniref:F-box domain, cyclin-like protein n=1 Tax=Beauveria brongniartii RCEF 3172 TaxID=1081107 RepID=A0A167B9Z3_9HYPO|nr:F-box domain, cyclin-like protein [Beauveria brongniartii RCEF 3172]
MPHISKELLDKLAAEEQSGHSLFVFERQVRQRTFRLFEKLPQELLLLVLELLDLQSLCRLSQTSIWARLLVLDFRPYREILEHAPTFPGTLTRAHLLSIYSAHQLFRQVICSDRCSSCSCLGEYVFLLTCERVCFSCFSEDDSFIVTEKYLAESIFQLNGDKLSAVPTYYCAWRKLSFVRTNEVKEIAAMANAPISLFAALGLDKMFIAYCSMRISPTITFIPAPPEAWPDGGRQCGGCELNNLHLTLISHHFDPSSPHIESREESLDKAMRRYSRAEFWDHVEYCPHADFWGYT